MKFLETTFDKSSTQLTENVVNLCVYLFNEINTKQCKNKIDMTTKHFVNTIFSKFKLN